MRRDSSHLSDASGLDPVVLSTAARAACSAIAAADDPRGALDAGLGALADGLGQAYVAALALEHDLLWVIGTYGHAVLVDGLETRHGVVGRAVRERRPQLVADVGADPDYVAVAPGVTSELGVPLLVDDEVVGVLNIETTRTLPPNAVDLLGDLPAQIAPLVASLRGDGAPDFGSLARFLVRLSSVREADAIADATVRAVARLLRLDACQLALDGDGAPVLEAFWSSSGAGEPLDVAALAAIRERVRPTVVLEALTPGEAGLPRLQPGVGTLVVLPLRTAAHDLGLVVGCAAAEIDTDDGRVDAAALMVAHASAMIDAALAITRERRTALTDPLTGLLNRRGLEEILELELDRAQDRRLPVSIVVADCDDLKDLNDRAGHEFGDAALRELGLVLPAVAGERAQIARVGGDEFAIVLADADSDAGEELAEAIRGRLVEGLAESGFLMHMSVGVATYPYDGAGASQLLRAADQALYEAKASGKNRAVSFRALVRRSAAGTPLPRTGPVERAGIGVGTKVLSEAFGAATAISEEETVEAVLDRLGKSITFVLGSVACVVSRVDGPYVVDASKHALRDIDLGVDGSYLIDEFPITRDVLATGVSKPISFLDDDLDRGEAFVLRELRMNCCLLMRLGVAGEPWGLVEVYDMRMRRFEPDAQAAAEFLVAQAGRRIEQLGASSLKRRRRGPLFRVPSS